MEFRQLVTFRELARELHFTRTAAKLHCVQSNVTAQIQALESELGTRLFDRLGRRVALTQAGGRFLVQVERLLHVADEARTAVSTTDEPSGTLSIGAPETVLAYRLPSVLAGFRRECPRVQLVFRAARCQELKQAVVDGVADLAFLLDDRPHANGNLKVENLRHEPLVLVAHPQDSLFHSFQQMESALAREALLLTEKGCSYRTAFENALAQAGIVPRLTMEFSSLEAIKQCAVAGMGIALLPKVVVASELKRGLLAQVKWSGAPANVSVQLIRHKDKWVSPAIAEFCRLTHRVLGRQSSRKLDS